MTSAISHSAQNPLSATHAPNAASGTTSPLSGAVPAQLPVRSYANATKTASPAPPTPAGASTQHAKSTEAPVNGANPMAQGGSQPNGTSAHTDHSRKPSVVISASGASGQIPNGGPVGQSGRPPINFGSMGASGSPLPQPSMPYQSQTSSLPAPRADPRVTSPAHSPSPIPQPQASGGRPPSGLQNQSNGMTFGSMGGEHDPMRQSQMPLNPGMPPMHERRQSSQSMHSDMSQSHMQNMNRGFAPQGGRGRGFPQQQFGTMPSPGPNYRPLQNQGPRPNMPQQFSQPPSSPYAAGRSSPAVRPAQPYQHQQHSQMQYGGYPPHMNQQHVYSPFPSAILSASRPASASALRHFTMSSDKRDSLLQPDTEAAAAEPALQPGTFDTINEHPLTTDDKQMAYPGYEPYTGHYQPYYNYGQYQGQTPQSPRPPYPSPYGAPQGQMQPPYHPPDMSRSASQTSQRPPSSLGQPQTPSLPQQAPHSQTPNPSQQPQQASSSTFVKPKKSSAIKITDVNGNQINFNKASPSPSLQAQPQTPVIVSTPNAPTPPPRVPSTQQNRADTQPTNTKSAEETKTAFQEQVRRQMEEKKRKEQEERDTKAKTEKDVADTKVKAEKDAAESKAKADKDEADAKVKADKDAADAKAKVAQDEANAKAKAAQDEADAKAKVEQDEADAKAKAEQDAAAVKAKEREEAESAAQNQIKEATAAAEKAAAAAASDKEAEQAAEAAEKATAKGDADKEPKEETEDERIEREIAEMEAADRAEEERERAFREKQKVQKEAQAKLQAEKDAKADEELKRQEREAEAREEARERERNGGTEKTEEPSEDAKSMFAALKKPEIGPGATATPETPTETSTEEAPSAGDAMPPPSQARPLGAQKPKPAHLKLETNKRVEPAEPTPGMQALKSARFLDIKDEAKYPDGFKSPNPALNQGGARKGRAYDKSFLLQFQNVFNEKPSVDWDQKVKETLGPGDDSARTPSAARTPSGMSSRQASGRPGGAQAGTSFQGVMGQFGGNGPRTLPPGTTSQERFAISSGAGGGGGRGGAAMPGPMGRMPSNLGMGAPGMGMGRGALQPMSGMQGPNSPRQPSSRGGRGGSKRDDRNMSRKHEADAAAKMPLTAHMELAPLPKSTTGWKPTSIGQNSMGSGPDLSGMMAPDLVQRKVKAALNKLTPEKFDKISDQILEIAAQSKNESDGRTLRQVIQLTFEKACDEAHWAGMYAKFCHKMLTAMSNDIRDETIKDKNGQPVVGGALFRKYLLNRCQEEFERGWQANLPDKPEGETEEVRLLSEEYYVAAAAKRRGLGLIQFIGQLYKLRMLTIRIMHECVLRLLNFEGDPDEIAVENLTTLLKSVGGTMDEEEQGRQLMGTYFQRIDEVVLKSEALGSRPKFMIMDLIDLRRMGWKEKGGASKGPKTLDEIHQEAAAAQAKQEAERARTSQRGGGGGGRMGAGRGDARNFSGNVPPPVDYNRTTVGMEDLRRLQNRGASGRATGGGLGPGGSLGPGSTLGARTGSRRGLGPSASGSTTRTNTPPVDKEKKDEPSTQQNAFSALASLDNSGDTADDSQSEAASPPTARNRSKSPLPEKADQAS